MSCVPSAELIAVPTEFDYCASPVCLSTGDVVGLSFTAQMGFMSALSVVTLLGFMAIRSIKNTRGLVRPPWAFIRTNIDGLMINLLIADLIMALGAILNIHWASKSQVSCGRMCDAQGAIQVVGETSVALFTLAIALLTFVSVVRGQAIEESVYVWGGIAVGVWAFGALWAGIGGSLDRFYAPTPYWCWISREFKAQQIGADYVWLWIAGFGSIFLYTPLFLMLRGNISWDPVIGWTSLRWSWRKEDTRGSDPLLWYPLAYTITILPLSVVRWISFSGGHVDAAASFVTVSIFNLSGLVNVGLILFARTGVFLLHPRTTGVIDPRLADPQLLDDDFIKEHQTGFGGVRVINQRDSSIVVQNIRSGRGSDVSLGGLGPELVSRSPSVPPFNEDTAGEFGPGRAYLESLGIRRSK